MLQSMWSQGVGHDLATEQQQQQQHSQGAYTLLGIREIGS